MSSSESEETVNGEIERDSDIEMVEEVETLPERVTPEKWVLIWIGFSLIIGETGKTCIQIIPHD